LKKLKQSIMIKDFNQSNSIINQYVAELRNIEIQKDSMRFRRNLERIGEIMAYEISKELDYELFEVETPLGVASIDLPSAMPVLGTIMRAGLPMHQGFLNVFDAAENAFVSAYRKHHKDGTFEIKIEYVSCPNLEGKVLIIADPMLATGASMVSTVKHLAEFGKPKEIHLAVAIAAMDGINYVRRMLPKAKIWAGAIDEELTAKSYIVPGLGDAGDLAFGEKQND
jgi:uracil phosphoribosyltransferase